MSPVRVHIGCGTTPIAGYINFDNSMTVRLAQHPRLLSGLDRLGLLDDNQRRFAGTVAETGIRWADATRHIPLADGEAGVVYSSHMLEHLDRAEARAFLAEARRVLAPGGVLRLAVPDLELLARRYLADGDADDFIERSLLAQPKPASWRGRVKRLVVGDRHHHWMYDARSLIRLVGEAGFEGAAALPAGETTIADPGELDLRERAPESLYVEGTCPS